MSKIFILLRDSDIYPFFTGERQFTKIQQDSLPLKSIQICTFLTISLLESKQITPIFRDANNLLNNNHPVNE